MCGLFSKKEKEFISTTGFYAVDGRNLTPLNDLPEKRSINSVAGILGYSTDNIRPIYRAEPNKIIQAVVFAKNTKRPLFIYAKESHPLKYSDLDKEIKTIAEWEFEE